MRSVTAQLRILAETLNHKESPGDQIFLSKKEVSLLDDLWDQAKSPKKTAAEEEDDPSDKGSIFGSKAFQKFWEEKYEGGKKRVPNQNPKTKSRYPNVAANTAMNGKSFRKKVLDEFRKWQEGDEDEDEDEETSLLPQDRYKDTSFKVDKDAQEILESHGLKPEDLADICGVGLSPPGEKEVKISLLKSSGKLYIEFDHDGIEMERALDLKSGTLTNERLKISPKHRGMGAKLFASQVESARRAGLKHIVCDALTQPPQWVGGLVWPKLGYDADLPEKGWGSRLRKEAEVLLVGQGHKPPHTISQLMTSPQGREFWTDTCPSKIDLSFSLDPTSRSSKILASYMEARAHM